MPLQVEVIPVAHHSAADRSSPHRKDYGVFFCTRTHARTCLDRSMWGQLQLLRSPLRTKENGMS